MALEQAWFLFFLIPAIAVGLTGFFVIKRKKEQNVNNKLLISNSAMITETPQYQSALQRYKIGIISVVVLLTLSMLGLSVISTKPVLVETSSQTKYNRDIVLCLDVSGSMAEVDYEIVKKFETLVESFKGERVGLVAWNSSSHMVFPLTDDYDYIQENLALVGNFFSPQGLITTEGPSVSNSDEYYDLSKYTLGGSGGSLIGDGLTACGLAFDKDYTSENRSKSIILATDNVVNGEPFITLEESVTYVTDENITVYGIKPTTGYETGSEAEEMKTAIEDINKGKYYELDSPEATEEIVTQITEEEATAIEGPPTTVKKDNPNMWIFSVVFIALTGLGLAWRFKL